MSLFIVFRPPGVRVAQSRHPTVLRSHRRCPSQSRGERARQPGPDPPRARDAADPLPPRTPTTQARKAPRRQRLRPPPTCDDGYTSAAPSTASRGKESSSQRLGRHRWTVERTTAWLAGSRRLHRRYERKAQHFLAFTSIACTLICYRRLIKRDDFSVGEECRCQQPRRSERPTSVLRAPVPRLGRDSVSRTPRPVPRARPNAGVASSTASSAAGGIGEQAVVAEHEAR
jgi:transposase